MIGSETTSSHSVPDVPMPPFEYRGLAGPTAVEDYDNPDGSLVFPYLDSSAYESVFDFGCGVGRIARQLIQQDPQPERYVGIDINSITLNWCVENLTPVAENFQFIHHDVFNAAINPGDDKPLTERFPVEDSSFTMVNGWSIFTHLDQSQLEFYMAECARILKPGGVLHATFYLFDRKETALVRGLPNHNAIYVDPKDPSLSVSFDRDWLVRLASSLGLKVTRVGKPMIRGHQWYVTMTKTDDASKEVSFPVDDAPIPEDHNIIHDHNA